MAKDKAIYAPGELGRVRQKLGNLDDDEAKRMIGILGGEMGVEKNEHAGKAGPPPSTARTGGRGGDTHRQPMRRVETVDNTEDQGLRNNQVSFNSDAIFTIPAKASYLERIKMDRYAALSTFEIKSMAQVISTVLSIFHKYNDMVNPVFIKQRMNEYYKKIEVLVVSTRTLFPRNNIKNNDQLKKMSPFMFSILDTIRYWNIERITSDMGKMQARPRNIKADHFIEILRAVYKPLFILERLDFDIHIKGAYKLLYKVLYIENPIEAREKYHAIIRSTLDAYDTIRKDIHYLLYPLLMKLLSDKWLPYQRFFLEQRNQILRFLNVAEADRIAPENMNQKAEKNESQDQDQQQQEEEKPQEKAVKNTEEAAEKQPVISSERKAIDRGLSVLESLFPQAGWDRLDTFPDLYPYFAKVLDLGKGYELIAPTDPLLQVAILMRILEELFFGLRYVSFGTIGTEVSSERIDGRFLEDIISGWHNHEVSFTQEYLSRLIEYCQLLESSAESRTSSYAKRLYTELQWIKRLCFLPHYRFETLAASPMKKSHITPLYPEIRKLRKYLTVVAGGIEQGITQGGAEKQALCVGINNPWAAYNFQVANPLSMRLNTLLGNNKRNNASLVFFTLSVIIVLDYFVNNENSWAYQNNSRPLFRSIKGEGIIPQFGVDEKLDADLLFKQVMKERQKEKKSSP